MRLVKQTIAMIGLTHRNGFSVIQQSYFMCAYFTSFKY